MITLANFTKKETSIKLTPRTIIAEILHDLINKKIINRLEADDCIITFGKQLLNKFNYIEDYKEIGHMSTIHVTLKQQNLLNDLLAPKEMIPQVGMEFEISPSLYELSKMTEN